MGTHPNAPSSLYGSSELLSQILKDHSDLLLSEKIKRLFNDLPFLFKVLSVNKALSIQAHPDKELAKKLFKEYPDLYKDDNHKPEMAIALTEFEALCGFRQFADIVANLRAFPELTALLGDAGKEFELKQSSDTLKALFKALMVCSESVVKEHLEQLVFRLKPSSSSFRKGCTEELIVRLNAQYPGDVGCFCALLLNYVALKPDEALFLAANEPHAYLSGDCIECMATSDNVVRSGLTPKVKDVKTLVDMLTFRTYSTKDIVMVGSSYLSSSHTFLYKAPVPEFSVMKIQLKSGDTAEVYGLEGPSILIFVEGSGKLETESKEAHEVNEGYVFFIGSGQKMSLTALSNVKAFRAISNLQ